MQHVTKTSSNTITTSVAYKLIACALSLLLAFGYSNIAYALDAEATDTTTTEDTSTSDVLADESAESDEATEAEETDAGEADDATSADSEADGGASSDAEAERTDELALSLSISNTLAAISAGAEKAAAESAQENAIQTLSTTNAGDFYVEGTDGGWTYSSNVIAITADGTYTITGDGSSHSGYRITIANGIEVTLTLNNVKITNSSAAAMAIGNTSSNTAKVTLILEGENSFTSTGSGYAGIRFQGATTGSLTITSNSGGSLTAQGGRYGAGIGGGDGGSGSNITISGGTVYATGGAASSESESGAGIGGGSGGSGSNITISGGTVTATTAGYGAAGIGGGSSGGSGTSITISGGKITATGGWYAAGIGGGDRGSGSSITISGGEVTAKSQYYGAGIGGGYRGSGSNITISGGTVTATGGGASSESDNGAGIGGGAYGSGTNITITGGAVTAIGGYRAAGIGGGHQGSGSYITISGGTVEATGGYNGSGIGGGRQADGTNIEISGGVVVATGGNEAAGIGGGYRGSGSYITISGGTVTATGGGGTYEAAGIGGGGTRYLYPEGGDGTDITISGGHVRAEAGGTGAAAIGWGENGGEYFCTVSYPSSIAYYRTSSSVQFSDQLWNNFPDGFFENSYIEICLNQHFTVSGSAGWGWDVDGSAISFASGGTYTLSKACTCCDYYDEEHHYYYQITIASGITVNLTLNDVQITSSSTTPMSIGSTAKVTLNLRGTNELISTASGSAGIQFNSSSSGSLTITSSSGGSLTAEGGSNAAGIGGGNGSAGNNITITGGTVTATGGDYAAGIGGGSGGSGSNITITDGDVTANGGAFGGAGIGGGDWGSGTNITISGGTIEATGGNDAGAGIGGGNGGDGSYIEISGGTVTAYGGDGGAAGIGGGNGGSASYITISGGDTIVKAYGGSAGAGIGGGSDGSGSNITITDGDVTATGGDYAAGIGGGYWGDGTNIEISGGTVTATGGDSGAGIGGGNDSSGSFIEISGGTVKATGGRWAAGIGGGMGESGSNITISGGIVKATGGYNAAGIGGGGYGGSGTGITISGGKVTAAAGTDADAIGRGAYGSDRDVSLDFGEDGYYWRLSSTEEYKLSLDEGDVDTTESYVEIKATNYAGHFTVDTENKSGWSYGEETQVISIIGDGAYTITTGDTCAIHKDYRIKVAGDTEAAITVSKVKITNSSAAAIDIDGTATVTLIVEDENSFTSTASGCAGIQFNDAVSGSLTIISESDEASLAATGGTNAAGIGGGYGAAGNNITITESSITATAGDGAQAIGSGAGGAEASNVLMRYENGYYWRIAAGASYLVSSLTDPLSFPEDYTYIEASPIDRTHHLSVSSDDGSWIVSDKVISITTSGTYTITKDDCDIHEGYQIQVAEGVEVNLTLDNLYLTNSSKAPVDIDGTATVTLNVVGANTLISNANNYAAIQFNDATSGSLTITSDDGSASLIATGGRSAAGIGGGYGAAGNNITILSGTVTATGGSNGGAGIGGGLYASADGITISGGTVVASGGTYAAGIGGGRDGSGSDITISGGTVTATGGYSAAGIGGGGENGNGEGITITGGTVTATGSWNGAGIGGGRYGSGSDITISGGTVVATGGTRGAGIGGGRSGSGTGITISGGTVTATGGGDGAADIGGGWSASGSAIMISDGSVKATNGSISETPTDGSGNAVYLIAIPGLSGVNSVTVDGTTTYTRNGDHPDDGSFYLYLTGQNHTIVADGTQYDVVWRASSETLVLMNTATASDFSFSAPHDLVYDGNAKAAIVTVAEGIEGMGEITAEYSSNGGLTWDSTAPTDVGTYLVRITVSEGDSYLAGTVFDPSWTFTITQATNEWTEGLSIEGWTYGESANEPTAGAKFGTVVFTYSDSADGTYTSDVPTEPGTYYVKASVAETANYTGLESDPVAFTISQADDDPDEGDEGGSGSEEGEGEEGGSGSEGGSEGDEGDSGSGSGDEGSEGEGGSTGGEEGGSGEGSGSSEGDGDEGGSSGIGGSSGSTTKSGWTRLAGTDRYETMAAVVQEAFDDDSSDYVVIASGQNFADSLTASSLAGVLDAPIILVGDSLTADTILEIKRVGATKAYIVGGTASVSESVLAEVEAIEGIESVKRISGSDRYATAVAVATETVSILASQEKTLDTVILASGTVYADALSISPHAYTAAAPIILVGSDGLLDDDSADWITSSGATSLIVAGGETSVAEGAITQTGISGSDSERLAGSDRYETSVEIAEWAIDNEYLSADGAVVASGTTFPDALAASALCGQFGSVLLLASASSTTATSVISTYADSITYAYFVGGTSLISEALAEAFVDASKISLNDIKL